MSESNGKKVRPSLPENWTPMNDAQGIAKMIVDDGGASQMLFEIHRDHKERDRTVSEEAVRGLADGFQGYVAGNIMAYWRKHDVPAQRVRVHVRIEMDSEGIPQTIDGTRRSALNLDVPAEEQPMPWYRITTDQDEDDG